jgi:hypothetical protein
MTDQQKQKIAELKKKLKVAQEQLILRKKMMKRDSYGESALHRRLIQQERKNVEKISDALNEAQGRTTSGRSQSNTEQNRKMLTQADKRATQRKTSQAAENEKIIQARRAMAALRRKHPNMGETAIRKIFKKQYPQFDVKVLRLPARFSPVSRNLSVSPKKVVPPAVKVDKPAVNVAKPAVKVDKPAVNVAKPAVKVAPSETAKETLWEYLTNPKMDPRGLTTVSAWKGGPDISIDSSDAAYDYDTITEKKGGSIKKGMKKAKAKAKPKIKAKVKSKSKKRASLRGWGAAKRGY